MSSDVEPSRAGHGPRSLTSKAVGGMGWMSLGSLMQMVLQLGTLSVLARLIEPRDFGLVAAATIAVSFTQVMAESGVGPALVQIQDLTERHVRTAFTLLVGTSVALTVVLQLLAPQLERLLGVPGTGEVLRVISVVFIVQGASLGQFILARRLQFRALTTVMIVSYGVGYGAVSIALALSGAGVWAIVAGTIGQAVVRTVLFWILAPHNVRPLVGGEEARQLLSFGGGHTLARLANWTARQGDNFVVSRYLGAASLGLYSKAYQMMKMPATLFGQAADQVLFPAMAAVQTDQAKLRRAYRRSVSTITLAVVPVSVLAAVMSEEVILLLLGPDWLPLRQAFNVMVFGILFRTSYKLSDSLARATGAVYRRAWRQMVYAVLVLVGAYVGQAQGGIAGVAVGVLIALVVNFLLMAQLSLTIVGLGWRQFITAHVPGAQLGLLVTASALPTSLLLERMDAGLVVTVCGVTLASAAAVIAALRAAGRVHRRGSLARAVQDLVNQLPSRAQPLMATIVGSKVGPRAA